MTTLQTYLSQVNALSTNNLFGCEIAAERQEDERGVDTCKAVVKRSQMSEIIGTMRVLRYPLTYYSNRTRLYKCVIARHFSQHVPEESKIDSTALGEKRLKKKDPFAKNLFLGKFDVSVLAYPEALSNERLQTLNELVLPIEKFFSEDVDSKFIDQNSKIPEETLKSLKSLGLFGQQIPVEYGGLGLNATEYARLAEVTALDGSIAVTLAAHQAIGLKGLLVCGTEEQKRQYLPRLATGEWVAAFCLTEPCSGSDAASIQTSATLSEDGKTWILNGSKLWISNGGIADFFTVFAKTKEEVAVGFEERVTAFIVERGFGGVTNGKPEDKLGIRGSNTTEVHFDNTPVPATNVLGEVGGGFKVAMKILNSGRFSMGSSSAGVLKKLLSDTVEHAISRKQFGKPLKDFHLIQEKLAKVTCLTYAMESMAYLTAGMLDCYEDPDCSVEAAMVKVFSSDNSWYCISECLQIFGGLGYMKDYPYERYLRDCRITQIFEGTNEILRIFIALSGLQQAGLVLYDTVKKLRNPLFNPMFVVEKMWERRRHTKDYPKLNLHLCEYLHPSLRPAADHLEYCVLRLQYAVEIILARYGTELVNYQMELKRLADIAIDIYALTAVLSRASRSYCIGLREGDSEILIAGTFSKDVYDKVKATVKEIEAGEFITNDRLYRSIAEKLYEHKGYFPVHPLTRNF